MSVTFSPALFSLLSLPLPDRRSDVAPFSSLPCFLPNFAEPPQRPTTISISSASTTCKHRCLLSVPKYHAEETMASCFPSVAMANVLYAKGGGYCYNAQIRVEDDESEESLLRRFRREVMRSGVIRDCKRRRFFESTQEKRKRKSRHAAQVLARSRNKQYKPKAPPRDAKESKKGKADEEEDNWELPEGQLP